MNDSLAPGPLHERYDWLDQARGLVVLLLVVSMATDKYRGDVVLGDPPLGPTLMNHGYAYFDGFPAAMTFIDSGHALFMIILGFVGYLAFTSRLKKKGGSVAFWYGFRRVAVLYFLSAIAHILLPYFFKGHIEWGHFLYMGAFTVLAFGSMTSFLSAVLVPNADKRILIPIVLVLIHLMLYAFPIFDRRTPFDNALNLPTFPFALLGMTALAITGSCFGQWFRMDPENPSVGFKKRIVPISTFAFIAAYSLDWMQPAQHHDVNAAMQLQALYVCGFMLMAFYAFSQVGFRFSLLSSLGKNLLLIFAAGGLTIQIYFAMVPKTLLLQSPFLSLVLAGILPIAFVSYVAVALDRRGIVVRA
ncbi:MAG: hypothetical protein K1Y02_04040 [Candidatus Hydrogenedentes bacterium]|nr:hypothetical protein [Candidatus Hydrogenedentota bacterium]